VIVRLMGEGQWRVDEALHERLNEFDDQAMAGLEAGDEAELDAALDRMWQLVKSEGERLDDADLTPSDIVIPPSDLTLEETRQLVESEGLIPDLPS
jgi:hypothetical protein